MAQYEPRVPPEIRSLDELLSWVVSELRQISIAFEGVESVELVELHVEPEKRNVGMLVLADGSDWDPGSGVGVYYWNGSAWVFVG